MKFAAFEFPPVHPLTIGDLMVRLVLAPAGGLAMGAGERNPQKCRHAKLFYYLFWIGCMSNSIGNN